LHLDDSVGASDTVLGKTVSDLQSNIAISQNSNGGTVGGNSKYVTGYTGYSNNVSLQSGNYLAAKVIAPDIDNVTVTVTGAGAVPSGNNDGVYVFRITDTSTDAITITASATGYDTVTKVYSLSNLELETPNPTEFTVSAAPGDATVFGKTVSDIQSNISIAGETDHPEDYDLRASGTVSKITTWSEFPSASRLSTSIDGYDDRHYVALKIDPVNTTDVEVTYTARIHSVGNPEYSESPIYLPGADAGNGIYVFNLATVLPEWDPDSEIMNIVEITASATGYESVTHKIKCNSLTFST
jgi:hypothetical protein